RTANGVEGCVACPECADRDEFGSQGDRRDYIVDDVDLDYVAADIAAIVKDDDHLCGQRLQKESSASMFGSDQLASRSDFRSARPLPGGRFVHQATFRLCSHARSSASS